MPHIIVEYSKNLEEQIDIPNMLSGIHGALAGEGIDQSRIKTRGHAIDHAVVGDQGANGSMAHTTLLLLEGRDIPTKKQYGDAIHAVLSKTVPQDCSITLEIRDMVKDTYYL